MFRVTSNAESVFLNLQRDLQYAETNLEINLRRAAIDALALIVNRIQIRGEGSNGQRLITKAILRTGAYSKGHAKRRSERGHRIDQVDFTNEGDLMRDFNVLEITPRLVTAGFLSDAQADKAGYLEAYFGDAFYLSDNEQRDVVDGLVERIVDDFKGR